MSETDLFQTETMARIYFSQGRYPEAEQIYRRLIRANPEKQHLVPALLEAGKKALEKRRSDTVAKTAHWIRLLMRLRDLEALGRIQRGQVR